MSESLNAYHLIIKGRVQGVFFRANALREARKLKLAGWVKNESDGNVEIWVEGPEAGLKKFVSWCWRGSEYSSVVEVLTEVHRTKGLRDFEIKY